MRSKPNYSAWFARFFRRSRLKAHDQGYCPALESLEGRDIPSVTPAGAGVVAAHGQIPLNLVEHAPVLHQEAEGSVLRGGTKVQMGPYERTRPLVIDPVPAHIMHADDYTPDEGTGSADGGSDTAGDGSDNTGSDNTGDGSDNTGSDNTGDTTSDNGTNGGTDNTGNGSDNAGNTGDSTPGIPPQPPNICQPTFDGSTNDCASPPDLGTTSSEPGSGGGSSSGNLAVVPFFAVGGAPGRVQVHRLGDGSLVADFAPYGPSYTGGISVAVGDISGDGVPDLVTAATVGNPHVKVYDGRDLANGTFNPSNPDASLLASFFAYGLNFNVGANVAVGDISGDGFADLVTGTTAGNPQVKVYDGNAIARHTFNDFNPDASLLASFFAYGINFNIGANVAVGDVNHDGFADLVTGATAGNPQVKVYDGKAIARHTLSDANPDASLLASFFAFGLQYDLGAFVSVGDVTGNGYGDVIVGATAGNPQVKVYDGRAIAQGTFNDANPDANLLTSFFAFRLSQGVGVSVSAASFDNGGPADILTGAAQGAPHYRLVQGLARGTEPSVEHGIDAVASDIVGGILVGA